MTSWLENPLRTMADVEPFESARPLRQRLSGDSIDDVLVHAAEIYGDRTALTMVMTTTAVGKFFKPERRRDAVRTKVRSILDEHGLAGEVEATTGSLRQVRVNVTLKEAGDEAVARLQEALGAYLFESTCSGRSSG